MSTQDVGAAWEGGDVGETDAAKKVTSIKAARGSVPPLLMQRGVALASVGNATAILARDAKWDGVLAYDELRGKVRKMKPIPTHTTDKPGAKAVHQPFLSDYDILLAANWCERFYKVAFSRSTMARAMLVAAKQNAYHPVRDYLESCKWDGKKRLDKWLVDYVQVEDSPYVRAVGSKWMISAVARAFAPGAQVDHVLVIEGEQRGGKSTALQSLCPNEEWFLDTTIELGTKDALQIISGKWIVEFAEMGSMTRGEVARIKAFITSKCDTFRKAYAENEDDKKRTCVFAGSVNPEGGGEYLKDETGGGRWWPVWSNATIYNRVDRLALVAIRDQLWGEALARYRAGEVWHLIEPGLIEAAEEEQNDRRSRDPWEEPAARWLLKRAKQGVTVTEMVRALGGDEGSTGDTMRAARVITALGWRKAERPVRNGVQVRLYRPKDPIASL